MLGLSCENTGLPRGVVHVAARRVAAALRDAGARSVACSPSFQPGDAPQRGVHSAVEHEQAPTPGHNSVCFRLAAHPPRGLREHTYGAEVACSTCTRWYRHSRHRRSAHLCPRCLHQMAIQSDVRPTGPDARSVKHACAKQYGTFCGPVGPPRGHKEGKASMTQTTMRVLALPAAAVWAVQALVSLAALRLPQVLDVMEAERCRLQVASERYLAHVGHSTCTRHRADSASPHRCVQSPRYPAERTMCCKPPVCRSVVPCPAMGVGRDPCERETHPTTGDSTHDRRQRSAGGRLSAGCDPSCCIHTPPSSTACAG